jgi:hypothetical protein
VIAVNSAQFGDVVTLQAGATYTGRFVLPRKEGAGWIVVRTNTPDGQLPSGPSRRVGPDLAPRMARLVAPTGSVVGFGPGAHHYRLIGLEITVTPGGFAYNLVGPATDSGTEADQPGGHGRGRLSRLSGQDLGQRRVAEVRREGEEVVLNGIRNQDVPELPGVLCPAEEQHRRPAAIAPHVGCALDQAGDQRIAPEDPVAPADLEPVSVRRRLSHSRGWSTLISCVAFRARPSLR